MEAPIPANGRTPQPREAWRTALLFPYFQPIVEVASGRILCYEALARTVDPAGNIVSAGNLFSDPRVSADNQRAFDHRVRRLALAQAQQLPANTRMSLNISPQLIDALDDGNRIPTLDMILEAGVDPARIVIELTELGGDIARLRGAVDQYRLAGMQVAIDDFGVGFSQLDRVIALEPDIIKLDMQLFKQAAKGGIAGHVVESLVELSLKSGAHIVCEGVESAPEFHFGLRCGARYMQGYLFAPAGAHFLPVDTFAAQIRQLRSRFFTRMRDKETQRVRRIEQIKRQLTQLRALLQRQSSVDLATLRRRYAAPPELIRFYICDTDGTQISANYDYNHQRQSWTANPAAIGHNWSWRPHFYQLMSKGVQRGSRFVASSTYQDLSSGRGCQTLATLIAANRVLLVDTLDNGD